MAKTAKSKPYQRPERIKPAKTKGEARLMIRRGEALLKAAGVKL